MWTRTFLLFYTLFVMIHSSSIKLAIVEGGGHLSKIGFNFYTRFCDNIIIIILLIIPYLQVFIASGSAITEPNSPSSFENRFWISDYVSVELAGMGHPRMWVSQDVRALERDWIQVKTLL